MQSKLLKILIPTFFTTGVIFFSTNPSSQKKLQKENNLDFHARRIKKFAEEITEHYDLGKNDYFQITSGGPPNIIIYREKQNLWELEIYKEKNGIYEIVKEASAPIIIKIPKKNFPFHPRKYIPKEKPESTSST